MITLVVPPTDIEARRVEVTGASYRHLFRARRVAVGEQVRLVDGQGRAVWSQVETVDRKTGVLRVEAPAPLNLPRLHLEVAVAALAGERAAWMVEKLTEMGVTAIHFFACQRSPRRYTKATLERLRRVARAAVEQSHRSLLPEVHGVVTWSEVERLVKDLSPARVLEPSSRRSWCAEGPSPRLLLVGPEGGWTREESQELTSWGAQTATLGAGILRVETAAVAAGALVLYGGSQADG